MKGNIENGLKESLDKFEIPYNPKAWEALKVKLDAKAVPIRKPNYKIYAAVAGVTAIVIGSILHFNSREDNKIKTNIAESKIEQTDKNIAPSKRKVVKSENITPNTHSVTIDNEEKIDDQTNNSQNNTPSQPVTITLDDPSSNPSVNEKDVEGSNSETLESPIVHPTIIFNSPSLTNSCVGMRIDISNDNDFELAVLYPNGTVWKGQKHSNAILLPNTSGDYKVGYYENDKFIEKETFTVNDAPNIDFQFENSAEKFNNGLPQTIVSTNAIGNIEWNIDGQVSHGNKAVGHLFEKGQHPIALSVTDVHGCKQKVTKVVTIEENFNLMAVNSFIPTDVDPLLNRFMPFSLTQREVGFELLIFDPKDGHLLYKTNDASIGWDGIDIQTGNLVQYDSAYIWKVILHNPAPGEKTEYAGTIVPRERRR